MNRYLAVTLHHTHQATARSGSGRSLNREEFVVVGWTDPEGSRQHIGALLLAYYTDDGRLHYAGRAGTGMNDRELKRLAGVLAPLQVPTMLAARATIASGLIERRAASPNAANGIGKCRYRRQAGPRPHDRSQKAERRIRVVSATLPRYSAAPAAQFQFEGSVISPASL